MKPRSREITPEEIESLAHPSAGYRERVTEQTEERRIVTTRYRIPAYGFIERLEIQPRYLLPNMDAARRYSLEVHLYDPNGDDVPIYVEAVYRNMKDSA